MIEKSQAFSFFALIWLNKTNITLNFANKYDLLNFS